MNIIYRIYRAILRRTVWATGVFLPIKNNKIVISSYYGKGYGDNPKYIVEELLKRDEKFKIIWLVNKDADTSTIPEGVSLCISNSMKSIYHLSTAKVWIDNCRKNFMFKKKNQYYIQTWHGFALKRIEKDAEDSLSPRYVKKAIQDSKAANIIISEAEFMTEIYKNAFWYDGEIVEWGSPRNDIILDKQKSEICRNKILQYFNIDEESKILLYAPTFRANHSLKPYSIDFERLKKLLEQKFDNKFVILIRLHPGITKLSEEMNIYNDSTLNASYYPDMQELLAAVDIVISDYSSLMFDFALSYKPCFQFATDIDDYKKDRNFYFELDKLPFSVATNNDELEENIMRYNPNDYRSQLKKFYDEVGMVMNGDSSLKCANLICNITRETKNE